MGKKLKIGIVGAGIQGISNALFLQKKGFQVTIFDRDEPGSPAASYGNAGHFSPYASLSLNRTDVLADVPAMLLSSTGPLALKWNYVPKMIPWFVKFILNTSKKKIIGICLGFQQILFNEGWNIIEQNKIYHGFQSQVFVNKSSKLFTFGSKFKVGRYHSLKLEEPFNSKNFDITMRCVTTNVAMSFENNVDKIYGFQFHPESFLTINGNLLIKKILSA